VIDLARVINRRKLAKTSKVSLREITRVLSSKVEPSIRTVEKLEDALKDAGVG
jgi:DNA-binding phage protein